MDDENCNMQSLNRNNDKWKEYTTLIVGDSLILGIGEVRISGVDNHRKYKKRNIKIRLFRGAGEISMFDYIKPLLKKCPTNIIIHIATNDTVCKQSRDILNEMLALKRFILSKLPTVNVIFSNLINC